MTNPSKAPFLLEPFTFPHTGITLSNRVILAPLTRGRSGKSRIPNELNLKYYLQRASAGLVITEATSFSTNGHGWNSSAAIETMEQAEGWKKIVDALHEKNTPSCIQLWHMGRASHSSFMPNKEAPVGPSAIKIEGEGVWGLDAEGNDFKYPHEEPRALEVSEIEQIIKDYAEAAKKSKYAGFDLIEVHAANGYLLDQFLQSCSNKREDEYGGSIEKRFNLIGKVLDAVIDVVGDYKVGIRLSPNGAFNGMGGVDNIETFTYVAEQLSKRKLAYIHVMDGTGFGFHGKTRRMTLFDFKKVFDGPIIGNVGYTRDTADGAIRSGAVDLIAFGRPFLGNPDLPERFANDWPLVEAPYPLWFSHDEEGYTTFPKYEAE